eukprot:6487973-Amphidinium_carterae.1
MHGMSRMAFWFWQGVSSMSLSIGMEHKEHTAKVEDVRWFVYDLRGYLVWAWYGSTAHDQILKSGVGEVHT